MSNRCENSFKNLTSDLLLTHYDSKQDIVVASDVNDASIGAVILYKFKDGKMKDIARASRSSVAAEKRDSQIVKEALAIILKMVHGRTLILQTDHRPLLSTYGSKKLRF